MAGSKCQPTVHGMRMFRNAGPSAARAFSTLVARSFQWYGVVWAT
jgi:hypothetical protein